MFSTVNYVVFGQVELLLEFLSTQVTLEQHHLGHSNFPGGQPQILLLSEVSQHLVVVLLVNVDCTMMGHISPVAPALHSILHSHFELGGWSVFFLAMLRSSGSCGTSTVFAAVNFFPGFFTDLGTLSVGTLQLTQHFSSSHLFCISSYNAVYSRPCFPFVSAA